MIKTYMAQQASNYIKKQDIASLKGVLWQMTGNEINTWNGEGQTLLTVAILERNQEAFDLLVEHNANINQPNEDNTTQIYWAVLDLDGDFIEPLVRQGAEFTPEVVPPAHHVEEDDEEITDLAWLHHHEPGAWYVPGAHLLECFHQ